VLDTTQAPAVLAARIAIEWEKRDE